MRCRAIINYARNHHKNIEALFHFEHERKPRFLAALPMLSRGDTARENKEKQPKVTRGGPAPHRFPMTASDEERGTAYGVARRSALTPFYESDILKRSSPRKNKINKNKNLVLSVAFDFLAFSITLVSFLFEAVYTLNEADDSEHVQFCFIPFSNTKQISNVLG